MSEFELVTLKSGIKSLRSLDCQEIFHPAIGPVNEATLLHIEQQRMVERSLNCKKFVIWDVGLGAAANAITALEAFKNTPVEIELHSFDRSTRPLEFALKHSQDLEYLVGYEDPIRELVRNQKVKVGTKIEWNFHPGDFTQWIQRKDSTVSSPHSIVYDPYSPAKNPEMWTLDVFTALRKHLDPHSECLLSHYSRSTAIRTTLLLAGFFVGVGRHIGTKAETTLASNQLHLLNQPLDRNWLKKLPNSQNSAPLKNPVYTQSTISSEDFEKIRTLPQFTTA